MSELPVQYDWPALKTEAKLADVSEPVREIVQRELDNLANFCRRLAEGEYPVC